MASDRLLPRKPLFAAEESVMIPSNSQMSFEMNGRPSQQSEELEIQSRMLDELRMLKALSLKLAEEPPLRVQAWWSSILQAFGFVGAILFGAFAILAWKEAKTANAMSEADNVDTASANQAARNAYAVLDDVNDVARKIVAEAREMNKLAILRQCQFVTAPSRVASTTSIPTLLNSNLALCSRISADFSSSLSAYVDEYYPDFPTQAPSSGSATVPTPTASSSSNPSPDTSTSPSSPNIAPIIGGVIGGLISIIAITIALILLKRRERSQSIIERRKYLQNLSRTGYIK